MKQVETRKLSLVPPSKRWRSLPIISPVTRAEIEEIRGVSVSSRDGGSTARDGVDQVLVAASMTPGRPVTFVVTQGFLDHFALEKRA